MAVPLVPIFECVSITRAPEGKLPSEADLILLIYNFTPQERKVGITKMCCPIRTKQSICSSEEGCKSRGDPCLMLKLKERWSEAEMPLQDDDFNIQRIMKKVKAKFDNRLKNRLTEVKRRSFVEGLQHTTVNLAPRNLEAIIQSDRILSQEQKQNKITIMRDYIGPEASRMALLLEEAPLERLRREEELQDRWNQQLRAEEADGGSGETTSNNNIGDARSSEEGTCGGLTSGGSDFERSYQQRSKRQKNRKRKAGIEDDDNFVNARIPKDLLSRLSMLGAKLDVSLRCHLTYTMAFYEACGNNI